MSDRTAAHRPRPGCCTFCVLACSSLLALPAAASGQWTEVHYVMGTYFRVTIDQADTASARAAVRRCFAVSRRLDERFSRFEPDSELARLNTAAGTDVQVSPEMAALLHRARALEAATGGTFDVSVGALTALWRSTTLWPTPAQIAAVRQVTGAGAFGVRGLRLHRRPGVIIDLDGIAKGWAVDRCMATLRASGVQRAFLDFGESSLYALGAPRGASGWRVVVRDVDPENALGTLRLRDAAVSVSAVFGTARRIAGRRVGHIVDPRSGLPLTTPAMALAVAASATDAEAFSKALLIAPTRLLHGNAPPALAGALYASGAGVRRAGALAFTRFRVPPSLALVEALP